MLVLKQIIDLAEFGWPDCQVVMKALTYQEAQDLRQEFKTVDPDSKNDQTRTFEIMKQQFISGTGLDEDGKTVDLSADDLPNLPVPIFRACVDGLMGINPSPNS